MQLDADLALFYADFGVDVHRPVGCPSFRGMLDTAGLVVDRLHACGHTLRYPAHIVLRRDDLLTIAGTAYKVVAPPLPVDGDGAEWSADLVKL